MGFKEYVSKNTKSSSSQKSKLYGGGFAAYSGKNPFENIDAQMGTASALIQGAYGGWQDAETMASSKRTVSNTYNRLVQMQQYVKDSGEQGVDFSETIDAYKGALDSWDLLSSKYGKYASADEYNKGYQEAMAYQKELEKKGSADLDVETKSLEGLNELLYQAEDLERAQKAEQNKAKNKAFREKDYRKSKKLKEESEKVDPTSELQMLLQKNGFSSVADLRETIAQKKVFIREAKDFQRLNEMSSVIGGLDYTNRVAQGYKLPYEDYLSDLSAVSMMGPEGEKLSAAFALREHAEGKKGSRAVSKLEKYRYLEDDEFDLFAYYLAKDKEEGTSLADEYLKLMETTLLSRQAVSEFDTNLKGNDFLEVLHSIPKGLDDFTQGVKGLFVADEIIAPTVNQLQSELIKEDLKDAPFASFLYDVGSTTANMLPSLATGAAANFIAPGAGTLVSSTLLGSSAAGNAYQEMLKQGYNQDQARAYATLTGLSETLMSATLSKVFGGKVTKPLERAINSINGGIRRFAANFGLAAASEGFEEAAQEFLSPFFENLALGYEKNTLDDINWGNVAYSGLLGAVSGGLFETASAKSGLTKQERAVVNKIYKDSIGESEADGKKLTSKEKEQLYDKVMKDLSEGQISTDAIEEILGGESFKSYKDAVAVDDAAIKELERLYQGEELEARKKDILDNSKAKEMKTKLGENVFSLVEKSRLGESYREKARLGVAYDTDLSQYSEKQQAFIKKAIDSKVLNNTRRTHRFVDLLAKFFEDRDIDFDFTNNEKLKSSSFAVDGAIVNGYKTADGNVVLNLDSPKYLNSVVGHEVTHVLEGTKLYDELRSAVEEFAQEKGEYDARLRSAIDLYKNLDGYKGAEGTEAIKKEVVADLVGDYLFTDEKFVQNLYAGNRNLFQKLWDEVKYLYDTAVAAGHGERKLLEVKRAFEKAYQEGGKAEGESKLSLSEVKNPITIGMTDSERYEALKERVIYNVPIATELPSYALKNIPEISSWDDINKYLGSEKREIVRKIANEFGVFDKELLNEDIELSFEFSRNNFEESYSKQKRNYIEFAKIFSVFNEVVEGAIGVEIHNRAEYKTDPTLDNVFVLMSAYQDGEHIVPVKLEIKKFKDKQNTLYVAISLGKIKMTEVTEQGNTKKGVTQDSHSVNVSIARIFSKINPSDKKFLKYLPDGFLNDAQMVAKQEALKEDADNTYKSAIKRKDMQAAQRMVDEAAKAAGYTVDAYHGTNQGDFYVFDWDKTQRADGGFFGRGHYFTKSKSVASRYGERIVNAKLKTGKTFVWSEKVNKYNGKKPPELLSRNIVSRINMAKIFPSLFADKTMSYWEYDQRSMENVEKTVKWSELEGLVNNLSEALVLREYGDGTYRWHTEGRFWEVPVGESYPSVEEANNGKFFAAINALKEKYEGLLSGMSFDDQTTYTQRYGTEITETLKELGYQSAMDTPEGGEIVVFDSSQIKSADPITYDDNGNVIPLSERFNAKKDDIRYSLSSEGEHPIRSEGFNVTGEDVRLQELEYGAPIREDLATEDAAEVFEEAEEEHPIAKVLTEEPESKKKKSRGWSKLVSNIFDKGAVFETLGLKRKNRELQAKYNSLHYSEGKAQRLIGKGSPSNGVRALTDIQAEVEKSGLTEQFYDYMYHKLNVDRMTLEARFGTQNKPVFGDDVTADDSRIEVAKLETMHPEFKRWASDMYAYNNLLRKVLVDGGVISQKTSDLFESMYPSYVPIGRVGKNGQSVNVPLDTRRTGVNAPIRRATGGNSDIRPLFKVMAERTLQTYKAAAKNSFGLELMNTLGTVVDSQKTGIDETLDGVDNHEELLQKGKNGASPTFTVFENGQRVTFEITEDMYDALKPTSEGLAYTNKALNKASNIHRGLLTEYSLAFLFTNAIKDAQDVLMNSQHAAKTYASIPKAVKELWNAARGKEGHWYTEYMENGGEQNTYFDNRKNSFTEEKSGLSKVVGMPLEAISAVNNFIERIPRLAEYIASRESGRSIDVSMLDAARITTNFAAGGDVTKFFNRNGATFLNASVQGFMQNVRNIREAKHNGLKGWALLATKAAGIGLAVEALNHLLWDDDDEYEELSDYVKQNYYVVAKTADGQFVRIPKGRTLAVIQNAFEQVINSATGNDEADLGAFLELAVSNLAPNNPIDNNIFAPIGQVISNKTWYGEDLVPTRLQDLPKAEQYDESTDAISKWLGEQQDILSPYQINYLLDQYSGGLGDVFLPMLTPEAERGEGNPLIAPFTDKFSTDSVINNQNVSDFYDKMDELTTNAKSSKATDEDVLKYKFFNAVNSELGDLYQQKREIQNSSLSDSAKFAKIRELQEQINSIARDSLREYENVRIDGVYAKVGDIGYHLHTSETGEQEWQKITDKQLAKQEEVTSGLGITPSQYWSNKEEWDYAYDNPEKYYLSKAVTNDLLEYRGYTKAISEIKADKDKLGNALPNSRKDKVVDYINGLDLSYEERIVLLKSVYPSETRYDRDIVEYINGIESFSYEQKTAALKALGFKIGSDGKIYRK